MLFYITIALSVLFAQYALEMRKVPETLAARQETWAYQVWAGIKYAFDWSKDKVTTKENDNDGN